MFRIRTVLTPASSLLAPSLSLSESGKRSCLGASLLLFSGGGVGLLRGLRVALSTRLWRDGGDLALESVHERTGAHGIGPCAWIEAAIKVTSSRQETCNNILQLLRVWLHELPSHFQPSFPTLRADLLRLPALADKDIPWRQSLRL